MSFVWNDLILNPMINGLLLLYNMLGNNFNLAIAVFTVLIRLLTLPLSIRQQRSSMRMQEMQPQIQAIQKKYRDNPQKMQEEFQKIGYNPAESLAGCLPLLIQFPILIGLYQAIITVLGSTPQSLFELTQRVAPWNDLTALLPIDNTFIWLNLAQPDPLLVLPILVFVSMFVSQKLLMPQSQKDKKGKDDNPAAAMTQSMQYTMPIMFGFFSLQFPAGLSIYFILSNIIGIGQGYYLRRTLPTASAKPAAKVTEAPAAKASSATNGAKKTGAKKTDKRPPAKKRPTSKRKRRSAKR